MTIRWHDGTVTKLKKPTGNSSAPWRDYFGIPWEEDFNKYMGMDPKTRNFVNKKSRIGFRFTIFD